MRFKIGFKTQKQKLDSISEAKQKSKLDARLDSDSEPTIWKRKIKLTRNRNYRENAYQMDRT